MQQKSNLSSSLSLIPRLFQEFCEFVPYTFVMFLTSTITAKRAGFTRIDSWIEKEDEKIMYLLSKSIQVRLAFLAVVVLEWIQQFLDHP